MPWKQLPYSKVLWLCLPILLLVLIGGTLAQSRGALPSAAPRVDIPNQQAGRLTYGTSVTGSVSSGSPSASYSFQGARGDLVNVQVVGFTSNMTPSITLFDSAQQPLTVNNNDVFSPITGDASLSWFLPADGLYLVVVSDANGQAVDFVLRLDGRPEVISPVLQPDVPVRVNIPAGSPVQFFRFEDQPQCFSTLTIIPEVPDFPFTAHIRSAVGQSVAILRGGALREDRVTVPPDTGLYEIEVGAATTDAAGYVVLVVTCAENAPFCEGAADLGPVDIVLRGGTIPSTPTPTPTQPPPRQPVVTRPVVTEVPVMTDTPTSPPPPVNDCGGFRLSSPREGLPNGGITVYWDPAPSATSYQAVVVNNDNGMSTGASTPAGTTNVGLDVSVATLGEGFSFTVQVVALSGDTVICRDSATMFREAPQDPTPFVPPPVCNGNTSCDEGETYELCPNECPAPPVCGDDICYPEGGEDSESCPQDCAEND